MKESWLERIVASVSLAISALGFLVVLACLSGQFVSRSVFDVGLIWADELARLSFVWCALFGAVRAYQTGALHVLDMFTRHLTGRLGLMVSLAVHGCVSFVLVFLVRWGALMTQRASSQTTETLEISGAWLYAPVPLAASFMLMLTVARLIGLTGSAVRHT